MKPAVEEPCPLFAAPIRPRHLVSRLGPAQPPMLDSVTESDLTHKRFMNREIELDNRRTCELMQNALDILTEGSRTADFRREFQYDELEQAAIQEALGIAMDFPSRQREAWEFMASMLTDMSEQLEQLDAPPLRSPSYEAFLGLLCTKTVGWTP